MNTIKDKVFLVTGGANGIGAGLVRTLLFENARHVAFIDIAEREGAVLELELNNKFGALRAKFIKCDVADEKQLSEAFKQVLDKYRRLDAIINNAGVIAVNENSSRNMIEVNFMAIVNSTYKAIEFMRVDKGGNGGAVINISSLVGLSRSPRLSVYSATRTAIIQFSNCIGMEENYSTTKVRVMSVCFGPTDTAILHRHNFESFHKDCTQCLTSRASHRQSIESAVSGVLEVIKRGESGSTWMVADDKPAVDITSRIMKTYDILSEGIFDENQIEP